MDGKLGMDEVATADVVAKNFGKFVLDMSFLGERMYTSGRWFGLGWSLQWCMCLCVWVVCHM